MPNQQLRAALRHRIMAQGAQSGLTVRDVEIDLVNRRVLKSGVDVRLTPKEYAILTELARIAFANMLDYLRVGDDGHVEVDLSRLNRDKAAAIQEVVVDYDAEPRTTTRTRPSTLPAPP